MIKIQLLGFLFITVIFILIDSEKIIAQEVVGSGAWIGIDLKKKLSKKFDFNFCPQLRTIATPAQFGSLLLEAGLEYEVLKKLSASAFYRYDISSTSTQHRLYFDLSGQHKFSKKINTELRIRIQRQFELNNLADNYLRPKLSIKYKLNKKISPFVSGELFYHIYYKGNEFDNFRFQPGINWDLKNNMSIKTYYLLDYEFNVKAPGVQHIAGITFGKDW